MKLTKSDNKILSYMHQNYENIIFQTITDVSEASQTSDASVIRLCRKLGYKGFQEFKIKMARSATNIPPELIHEGLNPSDQGEQVLYKTFSSIKEALDSTYKVIDFGEFEKASSSICNARKIVVFGLGSSASVAADIAHKLLRIGLNASYQADNHFQMIACCSLNEQDVIIGISHSGMSKDIVEAMKFGKSQGAVTICITNNTRSEITKKDVSDIKLFTASQETKYRVFGLASRLAQLAIADALYIYISMKQGDMAAHNISLVDESLSIKKY